MILGKVTLGSDRPRFRLKSPAGGKRRMERLPGKFTFTNGSVIVATTEDMREILEAGDVCTPNRKGKVYWIYTVLSSTEVKLTENFGAATKTTVNGYTDVSVVTMPFAKSTTPYFRWEAYDSLGLTILDEEGIITDRAKGLRIRFVFTWENLSMHDYEEFCRVLSFRIKGVIEVQPHKDVRLKFEMIPDEELLPAFTGGKLVGTDVTMGFTARNLITDIPTISSGLKGAPMII